MVVRVEMTPRRKRRLTYITIGLFFLLGGVEYGKLIISYGKLINLKEQD